MGRPAASKEATAFIPKVELPLDRRKHKRYQVKEEALISPVAENRKHRKMHDDSMGGASFRYIPFENLKACIEIDIAAWDVNFALDGIRFKVISGCEFTDNPCSFSKLRRCGVEFGPLTHLQECLFERFIRECTVALS
jgi:hypothetical protein